MAVYTDVSFEELKIFLAGYDLGEPHAFKGIAEGVSNSNYFLQTANGSYILTVYEMRVEAQDLPFYLGLMEYLSQRGVCCPVPVHTRHGRVTGILNGRPAAILTFLNGVSLRRPQANHCQLAGKALAEFHSAGGNFMPRRTNALGLDGWRKLVSDCAASADSVAPGLRDLIQDEVEVLGAAWPNNLPDGIIHADLFPDNVLFVNDRISGIIDLYFACNDALAYDLAVALNAWCFESDGAFNLTNGRALIAGYESQRPLSAEERYALPNLCRGAALRFLLTRLYDWLNHNPAALVRPKDPREFLRRLRFHRAVRDVRAYGL
jgi:homoserine kinase type II